MDDYTVVLFAQRVGKEIWFINTLYGSGEGWSFALLKNHGWGWFGYLAVPLNRIELRHTRATGSNPVPPTTKVNSLPMLPNPYF